MCFFRALYLTITPSTVHRSHRIEISYRAFPKMVGPRILSLESKVLITLEQFITSVVERKNNRNLNEQNFAVYWKTMMEDRGSVKKNLKIKEINKSWIVVMWAADCRLISQNTNFK